jgi:hypothetical protein
MEAAEKDNLVKQELDVVLQSLKEKGLMVAEETLLLIWKEINAGLQRYVKATDNSFDDLYLVIGPQIDKLIVAQIDKINGKVDL